MRGVYLSFPAKDTHHGGVVVDDAVLSAIINQEWSCSGLAASKESSSWDGVDGLMLSTLDSRASAEVYSHVVG